MPDPSKKNNYNGIDLVQFSFAVRSTARPDYICHAVFKVMDERLKWRDKIQKIRFFFASAVSQTRSIKSTIIKKKNRSESKNNKF
jgi:hypothetical protein